MNLVERVLATRLRSLLRSFPAVLLLGPRQCGKSTLVHATFTSWRHLDLERPADVDLLSGDVEGFLTAQGPKIVIDEAQRLPALFPALRHVIDRDAKVGRYVLTGSASPSLVREVSESLAGRVALVELTPFRADELAATKHARGRWYWGGYPRVHALRTTRARLDWLDAYVSAVLERDIPSLGLALPPARLRILWTMLTHVHGNLLNVSDLARSLGVSSHTVDRYLDVLEGTFMIRRLPPFFANVQKRLTKSPKVYVRDTGLLHFLAGLRKPEELSTWSRRGASFEGLVVEEIAARAADHATRPGVFFWRTQAGAEVDLLLVSGRHVAPIEVKLGGAVSHHDLAGLRQCMSDLGAKRGWVVTGGNERRVAGRGIEIVPWSAIAQGEWPFDD